VRVVDYPPQICCTYLEEERSRDFNPPVFGGIVVEGLEDFLGPFAVAGA
jgi:hypothetical protein